MPTTPRGYRFPSTTDTPDVPRDMGLLAADVDADMSAQTLKNGGILTGDLRITQALRVGSSTPPTVSGSAQIGGALIVGSVTATFNGGSIWTQHGGSGANIVNPKGTNDTLYQAKTSTRVLKSDIEPLDTEAFDRISPVKFRWRDDERVAEAERGTPGWGFIAEDAAAAGIPTGVGGVKAEYPTLDPMDMVAVLWCEVRRLRAEVETLKGN